MDSLVRIQECLKRLESQPQSTASSETVSYGEFLRRVQELREDIETQVSHVNGFIRRARKLRSQMKQELTYAFQTASPQDSKAFPASDPEHIILGTPMAPEKKFSSGAYAVARKSFMVNSPATPRTRTPKSLSKLLLQNKFAPRCTTPLKHKSPGSLISQKTVQYLDVTPQLPKRRGTVIKPSVKKTLSGQRKRTNEPLEEPVSTKLNTQNRSTENLESTPPRKMSRQVSKDGLFEITPTMNKKVSFFSNPNAGNIHKRYVAIQDSKSEESTCLLSRITVQKRSCTPEMPQSVQKNRHTTPVRKESVTPPLPLSSMKKRKPATPISSNLVQRTASDRTPSPPRPKTFKSRGCLETRLKALQLNTTEKEPRGPLKDLSQMDQTCELSQKLSEIEISAKKPLKPNGIPSLSSFSESQSNISSFREISMMQKNEEKTASLRPSKLLRFKF